MLISSLSHLDKMLNIESLLSHVASYFPYDALCKTLVTINKATSNTLLNTTIWFS